jgi:hypothetical protein
MEKILKILNLKLDRNQAYIFISLLISGLLITYVSPTIIKEVYSSLPAEWIAFESLFMSLSSLIIGMIWRNKFRQKIIKHFLLFLFFETILGVSLILWLLFINYNVWVLAIMSLFFTSFITLFVEKCTMVFKSKLWNNDTREQYDNNYSIITGLICIIGGIFALLFSPTLKVSLMLWGIAYTVDDIGWALVYIKNKNLHE